MNFLEKDLEDIIFESDNELLQERGLPINGLKKRQVNLGAYGIADLVTIERDPKLNLLTVTVYELKRGKISNDTLLQLSRYITGVMHYFQDRSIDATFKGVLIGSEIDDSSDFVFVTNLIDSVSIVEYTYDIDGISFLQIHNKWGFDGNPFESDFMF